MIFYGTVHGFYIGQHQNLEATCTSDDTHAIFMRNEFAFAVLVKRKVNFLNPFFGHDNSFLTLLEQTYYILFSVVYKK